MKIGGQSYPAWSMVKAINVHLQNPSMMSLRVLDEAVLSYKTMLKTSEYAEARRTVNRLRQIECYDQVEGSDLEKECLNLAGKILLQRIHNALNASSSTLSAFISAQISPPYFKPDIPEPYYGLHKLELEVAPWDFVADMSGRAGRELYDGLRSRRVRIGNILLTGAYMATKESWDLGHKEVEKLDAFLELLGAKDIRPTDLATSSMRGIKFNYLLNVVSSILCYEAELVGELSKEDLSVKADDAPFFGKRFLFGGGYLTSHSVETMIKAASLGYIPRDLTMAILAEVAPHNVLKVD